MKTPSYGIIRHYLVTALRNLRANRLLSAIAVLGLAVGLTGAILMALVTRATLGYDHFIAGYERVYLGISVLSANGAPPNYNQATNAGAAALIKLNVPEIEAAARLDGEVVELRHGEIRVKEKIYWGDPNIFDILPLPTRQGDLASALGRPDGIVMTRSAARKYFGGEDVLGQTLDVDGYPMTVRAVIDDLPTKDTDLESGIIASGLAAQSSLTKLAADGTGQFSISVRTYLRLRRNASLDLVKQKIAPLLTGLLPEPMRASYTMELERIDRLALHEGFHPGIRQRVIVGSLVAILVLFIAAANFVNLSVALSARRRREIGIRKASGAGRGQIIAQFLIETIVTMFIAGCLGVAGSECLLPTVNAFLDTNAAFDYIHHPSLILWFVLAILTLGLAAAAYPALLLSAFRPAMILNDRVTMSGVGGRVRNGLVVGQFAILIGLIIVTIVVYQQRVYAMRDAVRADIGEMLTVAAPCPTDFRQEVAALPGVRGTSCGGGELLTGDSFAFLNKDDQRIWTDFVSVLPDTFALYGLAPLAGSLDGLPLSGEVAVSRIIINQTAARRFGYASPQAAIGQVIAIPPDSPGPDTPVQIVAVVPDFALYSVESAIRPTLYLDRPRAPHRGGMVSIKLTGRDISETLAAIDRLWEKTGNPAPIRRAFVSEHIEQLYRGLERDTQLFAIFSGVAVLLACLGLVGLAVSTADRRTKEIGIRKALGASTGQIVALLLWQFSRPVLWANLLAWPIVWGLMRRWLGLYAYHVPLHAWLFPAAGLAALTVALVAVSGQAFLVARRKPVRALRYE
jgi:putative ABC transport system permease protein